MGRGEASMCARVSQYMRARGDMCEAKWSEVSVWGACGSALSRSLVSGQREDIVAYLVQCQGDKRVARRAPARCAERAVPAVFLQLAADLASTLGILRVDCGCKESVAPERHSRGRCHRHLDRS